jgi:hypothetical protein
MKWALLAVILFFILLFFTSVRISIEYKRLNENDHIHIETKIWFGLITLKFDIPLLQIQSLFQGVKVKHHTAVTPDRPPEPKKKKKSFFLTPHLVRDYIHKFHQLKIRVHDLNQITKSLLRHVHCEQLEWNTRVGVGDAAATGVITGVIWGLKTTFIGIFSHYVRFKTVPHLNVVPAFQDNSIDTQFFCIVRFRIGHAIIAGTRILLKLRKGREGIWQSTLFRA